MVQNSGHGRHRGWPRKVIRDGFSSWFAAIASHHGVKFFSIQEKSEKKSKKFRILENASKFIILAFCYYYVPGKGMLVMNHSSVFLLINWSDLLFVCFFRHCCLYGCDTFFLSMLFNYSFSGSLGSLRSCGSLYDEMPSSDPSHVVTWWGFLTSIFLHCAKTSSNVFLI